MMKFTVKPVHVCRISINRDGKFTLKFTLQFKFTLTLSRRRRVKVKNQCYGELNMVRGSERVKFIVNFLNEKNGLNFIMSFLREEKG